MPGRRVLPVKSQPFKATVVAVEMLRPGWFRLVLDLDEAGDVVRFDSFSNFRTRVRAVSGPDRRTAQPPAGLRSDTDCPVRPFASEPDAAVPPKAELLLQTHVPPAISSIVDIQDHGHA